MVSDVSFLRRLGAVFYDFLLIGASVFIVGGIVNTLIINAMGLPEVPVGSTLANLLFLLQVFMAFLLVGWFWTHGGQTLGMRAWKIRVVTEEGKTLNWQQSAMRFSVAIFSFLVAGVGFFIAIFDPQKLTWHDRFSRTYLIRV